MKVAHLMVNSAMMSETTFKYILPTEESVAMIKIVKNSGVFIFPVDVQGIQ